MEHLTALLEEFRATTKRQAIRLIAQRSDCTTATNSKFGGLPYLPKDFAYPTNAKGEPLKLLAQLNFAELPPLANFPTSGILQFFVLPNDVVGLGELPPSADIRKDYAVLYHKEIHENDRMTEFPEIKVAEEDEECFPFPLDAEFLVTGELVDVFANFTTFYEFSVPFREFCEKHQIWHHFAHFFRTREGWEVWREKRKTMTREEYKALDRREREMSDLIYNIFGGEEWHFIGGYPHFVQYDPRTDGDEVPIENLKKYDTPLFIMSSEYGQNETENDIMWGDAGIANFLINLADLQNLKFDDVLYEWSSN